MNLDIIRNFLKPPGTSQEPFCWLRLKHLNICVSCRSIFTITQGCALIDMCEHIIIISYRVQEHYDPFCITRDNLH
ncbi:hypothetical protein XELAEV_18033441mg [Xenopus laevis]|uniref:Uncharacterized protein n=1 Tax=Xenopus laevis TaxID=8355 RepID=A0A974HDZ9_XENLA|nr:hypothetical protein XELAEV_18033441mg [Xenopus laevis]